MKNKKISGIIFFALGVVLVVLGAINAGKPVGYILVGAGIFVVIVGVINFLQAGRKQPNIDEEILREKPEYRRKKTMLSRPEYEFYQQLKGLINADKYDIAFQVPLVSVVDKITQNSYRNELFRVVDFCIVDNVTFAPLLLIELNDASHTRADRADRDRKVFEICQSANMPIVAFTLNEIQDVNFIRKTINKSMLKK